MSERIKSQDAAAIELPEVPLLYALKHPETPEVLRDFLRDPQVATHLQFLLAHHRDSFEHCVRVGGLSIDLALDHSVAPEDLRVIGVGGILHDLGKCDVAEELLSSSSVLSPAERADMQRHTRAGFIRLADPAFDRIRNVVVAHHELKKNPYPRGGADRREPTRSSLGRRAQDDLTRTFTSYVASADMLDALAQRRSYKEPKSKEEVERILREQFTGDPAFIDAVMKRME